MTGMGTWAWKRLGLVGKLAQNFDDFYRKVCGEEWDDILCGLMTPIPSVERPNRWYDSQSDEVEVSFPMDRASIEVPGKLGIEPGHRVLDMCAAPGGKSLILWEYMDGKGELVLNDLSPARRHRLKSVIERYVPESRRAGISIKGYDASRTGMEKPGYYDRVLLDAPCSSEAHILQSEKAMKQWTPARSRQLVHRQFALICSGLMALRPGGRLVYSTCSVCPAENDGIIEKVLKRRKHPCELIQLESEIGRKTDYGWMIFPHLHGCGPMYFAALGRPSVMD